MEQCCRPALLNTTVGNVGKKSQWKYNARPDEALFSEVHTAVDGQCLFHNGGRPNAHRCRSSPILQNCPLYHALLISSRGIFSSAEGDFVSKKSLRFVIPHTREYAPRRTHERNLRVFERLEEYLESHSHGRDKERQECPWCPRRIHLSAAASINMYGRPIWNPPLSRVIY